METKVCTKCKKPKKLKEFPKHKNCKFGVDSVCKLCKKIYYKRNKKDIATKKKIYRKKFPWVQTYINIKQRCNNKNNPRYKDYGGRGIECLITEEEIKGLWFRDKAYLMEKPSIDRENNDGHYIFENCRFIELRKNIIKDHEKSIQIAEKYHNPNDGEVTVIFFDIIKRYESFVERCLQLSEDYEKNNKKLSEKFLNIAIKYDKFIEESKTKI